MRTGICITLFGWLAVTLPVWAQDDAPDAPDAPVGDATEAPVEDTAPDSVDEESTSSEDTDEFIFSVEIPADEQLVFPVNI
jgi:hypothetical protein